MHLIGYPSKKWTQLSTELICIRTLFSGLQSMSVCLCLRKSIAYFAAHNTILNGT